MIRPTPEERLAPVELHLTTDGERWREVVHRKDALRLMQEHADAEVEAATADLSQECDHHRERAQVNVDLREKAERERDEARAEVQDWRDGVSRVMAESCPSDERHCTCVPLQRAALAEIKAEVERLRVLLQRGLDLNIVEANGGGVDDWEADVLAALGPEAVRTLHPATADLVRRFSAALSAKLGDAERKYGRSVDWARGDWMDECRAQLREHVEKGDPRDVAAYCAFLWHHGESTSSAPRLAAALAPEAKEVPRG